MDDAKYEDMNLLNRCLFVGLVVWLIIRFVFGLCICCAFVCVNNITSIVVKLLHLYWFYFIPRIFFTYSPSPCDCFILIEISFNVLPDINRLLLW